MSEMKIAIVHDHLLEFGGAERVLVALKRSYPQADVYVSLLDYSLLGEHAEEIKAWNVKTSFANSIPFFKRLFSPLRFLWPLIWESFDFSNYDVVISSSGTMMSKGIVTKPGTVHICYLHHPPRYLYFYETAIEWQKYVIIRMYALFVNHGLRFFDYISSQRVDFFIANSHETLKRIKKFYRREGVVIYPPVEMPAELPQPYETKTGFCTISRLAKAKHVEVLVAASKEAHFTLTVVGNGRVLAELKEMAGSETTFKGHISDEERRKLYATTKAFLFASVDEEFGISPVEALGNGVPVIAYASGGLKETIQDGVNGFLYTELTPESLLEAIQKLQSLSPQQYMLMCKSARQSALNYTDAKFSQSIQEFVNRYARTSRS